MANNSRVIRLGGTGIQANGKCLVASPADVVADFLDVDGVSLRAASLRGPAHRVWEQPRQDSYGFVQVDGWVVAIVADGIGQKKWSHVGSAIAVESVAVGIQEGVNPHDLPELLRRVDRGCEDIAVKMGVESDALSTTLTIGALNMTERVDGVIPLLIHEVGDSPALLLHTVTKQLRLLSDPGKLVGPAVDAVVPNYHSKAVTYESELAAQDALVIATDGFLDHFTDAADGGPYARALASEWSNGPRRLIQYVADLSTNFDVPSTDDDRTVITLWNTAAHEPTVGSDTESAEPSELE